MILSEAYSILQLSTDANLDDVKKQYKLLAKKWHPDVNKDADAADKFKKINEAHDLIKNHKNNPIKYKNISFNQPVDINLSTDISFKESVLGCKRNIKFDRTIRCEPCKGSGNAPIHNGCTNCNGSGRVTSMSGNAVFIQACDKCRGVTKYEVCKNCNSSGILNVNSSIDIIIPAGVINGNVLRLNGMGNYFKSNMGFFQDLESYTNAFLKINVQNEEGLSLLGNDVLSTLKISLLEALTGCSKNVKTYDGFVNITIPALTKHNDKVLINKMGVDNIGNQIVNMDVSYPENVSDIIEVLMKKEN